MKDETSSWLMKEAVQRWEEANALINERIRSYSSLPVVSWTKPISPTCAPTSWNCVNAVCCLGTATFLVLGLRAHEMAELCYVPFNLVVCVLWLAEAVLWILFDEGDPLWSKMGELLLASYYIVDGIIYYYEWAVLNIPPTSWDIIFYSVIDIFIYLYYFLYSNPDLVTKLFPSFSNPSEGFDWITYYKFTISSFRKFFVWWLPTAITLMWLTCSQDMSNYGNAALLSTSGASPKVFLTTSMGVGGSVSLLQSV